MMCGDMMRSRPPMKIVFALVVINNNDSNNSNDFDIIVVPKRSTSALFIDTRCVYSRCLSKHVINIIFACGLPFVIESNRSKSFQIKIPMWQIVLLSILS